MKIKSAKHGDGEAPDGFEPLPDEVVQTERGRVEALVKQVVAWTMRDRLEVAQELLRGDPAAVEDGPANNVVENHVSQLARRLFQKWSEEESLDGVELWEGHCVTDTHGWFQIRGDAERLEDATYWFIVDPGSRGVYAMRPGDGGEPTVMSDILVISPDSPLKQAYLGRRVRRV